MGQRALKATPVPLVVNRCSTFTSNASQNDSMGLSIHADKALIVGVLASAPSVSRHERIKKVWSAAKARYQARTHIREELV